MLDVKRLIGEVTAQNGIRLEADDPAFALVTLNQLVLEEAARRIGEQISTAFAGFAESLSKGEYLAGKTLAQEVKAAVLEVREEWAADLQAMRPDSAARVQSARLRQYLWVAVGALSGMTLMTAGLALYRLIGGC
jgi:hypothetical protein